MHTGFQRFIIPSTWGPSPFKPCHPFLLLKFISRSNKRENMGKYKHRKHPQYFLFFMFLKEK